MLSLTEQTRELAYPEFREALWQDPGLVGNLSERAMPTTVSTFGTHPTRSGTQEDVRLGQNSSLYTIDFELTFEGHFNVIT